MLEFVAIFSTGGVLLWDIAPQQPNLRDFFLDFIRQSQRPLAKEPAATVDSWTLNQESSSLATVFVVYDRSLCLGYVPALCRSLLAGFMGRYDVKNYLHLIREDPQGFSDFEEDFWKALRSHEDSEPAPKQPQHRYQAAKQKTQAKGRVWDSVLDGAKAPTAAEIAVLDRSEKLGPTPSTPLSLGEIRYEEEDEEPKKVASFFTSLFSDSSALEGERLGRLGETFRLHLIAKNVAAEVAQHISDRVCRSVAGRKLGAFQSPTQVLREAAKEVITDVMCPSDSANDLVQLVRAKKSGPFTIVFVGVNGVGKSTNLSKVCFYLLQANLRVLVVACDTFRSGAVEQLKTHVKNLCSLDANAKVELFERGYGKDPARIAADAIAHASSRSFDAVLIDTAGRMQNNEPLMQSLAKLACSNSPDKIVFVGEALVGNEAVDQLQKFNQSLRDYCSEVGSAARQIDGLILTKFDTIDDKVGAALSMTFISGAPILFLGVGQTYTDLRRVNISRIVNVLLS